MKRSWRNRAVYSVLLPSLAIAAGILGYYSWMTASQFALLGEQTIAQSTLIIVQEKVEQLDAEIIATENRIFSLVDLEDPESFSTTWRRAARENYPSTRAVMLLAEDFSIMTYGTRLSRRDRASFLSAFEDVILQELGLPRLRPGRLKHWHGTVGRRSYLITCKAIRSEGSRYYAIAYHDTQYFRRDIFPTLFESSDGRHVYNVIDEFGRRVFGPNLAQAGDYLVGVRFPTTLYNWRLQVAPEQAPRLEAQGRTRAINEIVLIGTAFLVILLGVGFLLYAASKERRLNEMKSVFIANVSHELKTPLSVIRMFGEMLLTRRVRSDEKKNEYLEIICRESERLSQLIENVLDFSAVERGKRTYDMKTVDLNAVVQRALDAFRYRAEREGTTVKMRADEGLPKVEADEQAIVLAVINLLDNAAKYGEGSPIEVSLTAGKDEAIIKVRDRGKGIPEADLRRVFERFFRGSGHEGARGSGIGLSMVKHIASAHGGVAWAHNHPGGGAVVSIALPARRPERLDGAEAR